MESAKKNNCIGLVAAMPEEIAPLLRRVGDFRKEKAGAFNVYRFTSNGVPVVLVQSGMGPRHAAEATEKLLALAEPGVIVNFGFGGGVLPGLEVGDVVLAKQVFLLENGLLAEAPQPDHRVSEVAVDTCVHAGPGMKEGTFITAAAIMNKKEVAGVLGGSFGNPVLEMETAAVLQVAGRAGIPVLAVRAISDAAGEELGFSLEEFCDADLNIRIGRVLACVAKRPWIIPQLLRLSGNTKRAGERLAVCVEAIVAGIAGG